MTLTDQNSVTVYLADTNIGGAQRTLINIVNQWHRHGIKFDFVIGDSRGGATAWLDPEITYHDLNITRQLMALPKLLNLFWRRRPARVFTTLTHANIIVSLAALLVPFPIKIIVRETNNPDHVFAGKPVLKLLARYLYPKAYRVIALSQQVREELNATFSLDHNRLVTLPNLVEAHVSSDTALRHDIPVHPFIITVGRLNVQKNLPMLLTAYRDAGTLPPLYIIGDGDQKAHLVALAEQLGIAEHIYFISHEDNILAWMARAEIFVLASSWEGFGHVIVEAMSQGCPVIATACAGPIEIITDGKDGMLVPIDDQAALCAGLQKLMASRSLRLSLGKAAMARAKHYDAAKVSQRFFDVIEG